MFVHSLAAFFQRNSCRFLHISQFKSPLNFCTLSRNIRLIMPPKKRGAKAKTTKEPTVEKTITKNKDDKKQTTKKDKKEEKEQVNNGKKNAIETSTAQGNGDVPTKAVGLNVQTRARRLKATDDKQVPEISRKPAKRTVDEETEEGSSNAKQAKTVITKANKKAPATSKQEKTKKQIEQKNEEKSESVEEEFEEKPIESTINATKKTKKNKRKSENTTVAAVEEKEEEGHEEEAKPTVKTQKRTRGKKTDKKATVNGGGEVGTLKNNTMTKWTEIDFKATDLISAKQPPYNIHIQSWNVDGVRAWVKKGGLEILKYAQPDIFCIQETKCSVDKLPEELKTVENYKAYWSSCENKDGYSGVGILTKIMPIEVIYGIDADNDEFDKDGRCITAEFKYFYLINVYVPNAGRNLVTLPKRLEWNQMFKKFVKKLDEKKPVVVCGDLNVAHNEIDLSNPKANVKHAGFTAQEREGMTEFLNNGYIDTFRKLYPEKTDAFTFWTYLSKARAKNVGWRLDYYLVSDRIMDKVCDNRMHPEVYGSDHCPISLYLKFK